MRIKTKLTLGVGFLFSLILLLSIVAAVNINALKSDTENILKANYNSLQYCRNMLTDLEVLNTANLQSFNDNLILQEKNNTEFGEADLTNTLRSNYEKLVNQNFDSAVKSQIRNNLFSITDVNMQAIQRKSEIAKKTANDAVFWIAVSGTLCFIIAFILLVNLPSNIANPIKTLTESIKQIASKNYSQRVHFESNSEFGQLAKSFNSMAEKLQEYNNSNLAKLMKEKVRIETLINNMHDPVIGLDEMYKIIFINEEAIKLCGLSKTEIFGKSAKDLAIKNDLIRKLMLSILNTEADSEFNLNTLKIFDGNVEGYFEKESFPISIIPTGEKDKVLIGHVIILRNVTVYKTLDFAKTNFIATVSHEFKTPISSIKMSLHLMGNENIGTLNEEQQQLLESIKDDADRLLKITAELLNMTQVESGNIQLRLASANPKEIFQYAVNANKTLAEQKQINFKIDFPETVSQVSADAEKTIWVMNNLISNAIRYSYDNSSILLKIEEKENKIYLSVSDNGQGIDEAYQPKIFERYFRAPGTKKEGTGLGLSISKEFMEAQGGEITVKSEYGAGSIFTVSLNKLSK